MMALLAQTMMTLLLDLELGLRLDFQLMVGTAASFLHQLIGQSQSKFLLSLNQSLIVLFRNRTALPML
jgi:hypothetical protein